MYWGTHLIPRIQIKREWDVNTKRKVWRVYHPIILWRRAIFWHYFSYKWKLPKGELTRRAAIEKRPLSVFEALQDNIQVRPHKN